MAESGAPRETLLARLIHMGALVGRGLYLKESMLSKKMDPTWGGRWDLHSTNTSPVQICLEDSVLNPFLRDVSTGF